MPVNTSNLKSQYADTCSGKIPELVFMGPVDDYTKEQHSLEHKLAAMADNLREITDLASDVSDWLGKIERQLDLRTLDRAAVAELIARIEVGEAVKEDGKRRQTISIEYRFVGSLPENKEGIA